MTPRKPRTKPQLTEEVKEEILAEVRKKLSDADRLAQLRLDRSPWEPTFRPILEAATELGNLIRELRWSLVRATAQAGRKAEQKNL